MTLLVMTFTYILSLLFMLLIGKLLLGEMAIKALMADTQIEHDLAAEYYSRPKFVKCLFIDFNKPIYNSLGFVFKVEYKEIRKLIYVTMSGDTGFLVNS